MTTEKKTYVTKFDNDCGNEDFSYFRFDGPVGKKAMDFLVTDTDVWVGLGGNANPNAGDKVFLMGGDREIEVDYAQMTFSPDGTKGRDHLGEALMWCTTMVGHRDTIERVRQAGDVLVIFDQIPLEMRRFQDLVFIVINFVA